MNASLTNLSHLADAARRHPVPSDLSGRLVYLLIFGEPGVTFSKTGKPGWYASIKMNTNGTVGATYEIRSDYDHATPEAAVAQLIDRVHQAAAAGGSVR